MTWSTLGDQGVGPGTYKGVGYDHKLGDVYPESNGFGNVHKLLGPG